MKQENWIANLKVGDLVLVTTCGNLTRHAPVRLYKVKVSKVGRKYIHIEELGIEFSIDDGIEKSNYSSNYELWPNRFEYDAHQTKHRREKMIWKEFRFGQSRFTPEQVAKACEALGILDDDDNNSCYERMGK